MERPQAAARVAKPELRGQRRFATHAGLCWGWVAATECRAAFSNCGADISARCHGPFCIRTMGILRDFAASLRDVFVGFVHCGYWLVFGVRLRGIAGQKLKRIFGLVGRLIGFDLVAVVRLFSVFDLFSRNCFRQGGIELPYLRRGISNKRDLLQRLLPGLLAVIRCRAGRLCRRRDNRSRLSCGDRRCAEVRRRYVRGVSFLFGRRFLIPVRLDAVSDAGGNVDFGARNDLAIVVRLTVFDRFLIAGRDVIGFRGRCNRQASPGIAGFVFLFKRLPRRLAQERPPSPGSRVTKRQNLPVRGLALRATCRHL
ncbi:MAG TPA: hypothetical protein VKP52_10345 [Pseudolabrys sp.]|nr:hypothetical protein [Pseudolabrys sp.]